MGDLKRTPGLQPNPENEVHYPSSPRHPKQVLAEVQELVFWEMDNPRCVVNMLSEKLKKHALEIPPHLLSCSLKELRKKCEPNYVDEQLRISFWDEYFITMDSGNTNMRSAAIYSRVCTKETFFRVVEDVNRFAYVLRPPENYMYQMRALLDIGLIRFKEILQLPLENPNGTINTRLIGELVKIVSVIDNRVKGAVTQKIQIDGTQKNLNVNVNANSNYEPPKTHQEIQRELKNIEREIKSLQAPNSELQLFEPERESVEEDDGRDAEDIELVTVKDSRTSEKKA